MQKYAKDACKYCRSRQELYNTNNNNNEGHISPQRVEKRRKQIHVGKDGNKRGKVKGLLTSINLKNLASIQPRTSRSKFADII